MTAASFTDRTSAKSTHQDTHARREVIATLHDVQHTCAAELVGVAVEHGPQVLIDLPSERLLLLGITFSY